LRYSGSTPENSNTGYYSISPVQLDHYRTALTNDTHAQEAGTGLRAALEDLTAAGYDVRGDRSADLHPWHAAVYSAVVAGYSV